MVQDFTGTPSASTVQAPQWVVSHPICVPVSRRVSRRKCTRRGRGSTSAVCLAPLTGTVVGGLALELEVCAARLRPGGGDPDLAQDFRRLKGGAERPAEKLASLHRPGGGP